ncbi:methyltransferase [Rhexocercosporidium sp. MPI-PUGE-AT-0058]|nr:methyltransferase [Rhexocercosporidium sp. MPI-PUGE-AT-0058]
MSGPTPAPVSVSPTPAAAIDEADVVDVSTVGASGSAPFTETTVPVAEASVPAEASNDPLESQGLDVAIEADFDARDGDSAIGGDEVQSFTTANGRRYHAYKEGEYLFPNDESEQDRLDMLHHIFKLVLRGNLCQAPIPETIHKALDFGCGTGMWAIDFADEHPEATVVGNDLSPIQPSWVPPNLKFVVDDVEAPWAAEELSTYDYIHGRSMSGSISSWPNLFTQAFQALQPGGWLEMQEFAVWFQSEEGDLPADSAIAQWQGYMDTASTLFGKKLNAAGGMAEAMRGVGFGGVVDDVLKVPIGAWPRNRKMKEQGRWLQAQMLDAIEPISLAYCTRVLNWDEVKTQVFMAGVRKEFMNNSTHLYVHCHFVYGKKPGSASV